MKIYWAAPLFTMAERAFNEACARELRLKCGHLVYLPQDHERSFAIPVPVSGSGPIVDVSALAGPKTVCVSGKFRGYYDLLGSQDDVCFAVVTSFDDSLDSSSFGVISKTVLKPFKSLRLCSHALVTLEDEVSVTCEVSASDSSPSSTFRSNVSWLDWANAVVACLDGPDPDSGTSWECGYVFGKKPAVVFRTDARLAELPGMGPCNLMLWEASQARVLVPPRTSVAELCRQLDEAVKSSTTKRGR